MTNLSQNTSRTGLRHLLIAWAVSFILISSLGRVEAGQNPPIVVELFTSQGCSSCPPADALLGDLTKRKDVVALTFPVDYWDYLGWKDTLGSPAHTKRQRAYARARGDRQVYTPQMVLNGRYHVIGSRRSQVLAKINELSRTKNVIHVPITLQPTRETLTVEATMPPVELADKQATLWLIMFKKKAIISIKRGENNGRTITYHNVVRQMLPIGKWTGKPMKITLPKAELMAQGYDGCVALLQVNGGGPVLGVAYLADWNTPK